MCELKSGDFYKISTPELCTIGIYAKCYPGSEVLDACAVMKASTVGYIGYADDTNVSQRDYEYLPHISPRCEIHLFSTAPSESTRKNGLVRCLQHVKM